MLIIFTQSSVLDGSHIIMASVYVIQINFRETKFCQFFLFAKSTKINNYENLQCRVGDIKFVWVQNSNCLQMISSLASSANVAAMHFYHRSMLSLILVKIIFCYCNTKMILM